jgi:hypothetical protein
VGQFDPRVVDALLAELDDNTPNQPHAVYDMATRSPQLGNLDAKAPR